ncbi:unnamed protein product [Coffea canephora]|uniref:26S proteasome non-ATPase regulatory subunit 1/RPN2 N-terminal domain-containing protein n=1 Tax=Coffea canephora TaxID=49390 RepID=A0A068V2Y0_COFCA|nr:unnamed protein product [Coffea canephora]
MQIQCLLVRVFQKLPSPDYLSICQLLMFLDTLEDIAAVFEKLLRTKSKNDALFGFQIAFDLRVIKILKETIYVTRLSKIKGILSGETSIQLTLQFLYIVGFLHIRLHLIILNTIKQSVEMRNNICHNANSIMHAITTVNTLLCTYFPHRFICCIMIKFLLRSGLALVYGLFANLKNAHVRYSLALALGISCAGTGLSKAISLLKPLTSDVPVIPLLVHSSSFFPISQ